MATCKRVTCCWAIVMTALVGCSAPPYASQRLEGGSGSGKNDGSEGADEFEEDEPLDESESAPPESSPGNGPCSSSKSSNACLDCCENRSPDAMPVVHDSLKSCLCTTPGSCATECASSFCQGFEADAACATCMNGGAANTCMDTALSACEKDTTCSPFLQCITKSSCETKPAQ